MYTLQRADSYTGKSDRTIVRDDSPERTSVKPIYGRSKSESAFRTGPLARFRSASSRWPRASAEPQGLTQGPERAFVSPHDKISQDFLESLQASESTLSEIDHGEQLYSMRRDDSLVGDDLTAIQRVESRALSERTEDSYSASAPSEDGTTDL